MDSSHNKDINWDRLDKNKFYLMGAGIFTGLTVVLYPVSVIKTKIQVASKDVVEKNASSMIRNVIKTEGVPGLYKGFGTVITGAVPARIVFMTSLEKVKMTCFHMVEPLKLSEPTQAAIANGIAGMFASIVSQCVYVPIDVVSQKLMVQGYSGYANYNGGLDVAQKIVKSNGIRGLYKGFSLSVMTYSPSSAVWWASYGSSQRIIWKLLGYGKDNTETFPNEWTVPCVQATGGLVAGAMASCVTTPLDTIKTRLQVTEHRHKESARLVVKKLISEDGWKGLYRGLGPRFVSMSAWGTSMILAYEYLSMNSVPFQGEKGNVCVPEMRGPSMFTFMLPEIGDMTPVQPLAILIRQEGLRYLMDFCFFSSSSSTIRRLGQSPTVHRL